MSSPLPALTLDAPLAVVGPVRFCASGSASADAPDAQFVRHLADSPRLMAAARSWTDASGVLRLE